MFSVFYGGGSRGQPSLTAIFTSDLNGRSVRRLTPVAEGYGEPAWSPNGRLIAYEAPRGLAIMDARGRNRRLINSYGYNPRWSPDGTQLVYPTLEDGIEIIDVQSRRTRTLRPPVDPAPMLDWSPTGQIAFIAGRPLEERGIYVIDVDGNVFRELLRLPGVYLDAPRWSPNGKRLLFTWHRNRSTFLYVMDADGTRRRRLIPVHADTVANWSPDSRRIAYGVTDVRLLDFRTGRRRQLPIPICRRYSCHDLDW